MKIVKLAMRVVLTAALVLLLYACGGASLTDSIKPPELVRDNLADGFTAGGSDEFTQVAENDYLILQANRANGEIAVTEKASGYTWYSNPIDKESDGLAGGFNKASLLSQVLVNYSTEKSIVMNVSSYLNSVNKGGLTSKVADGSVIFIFDFPNESLTVPVKYSLHGNKLAAELLTYGVSEYGTNTINYIDILPFFGAAGKSEEGYMLVPDGSGALIYLNNGRTTVASYSQPLFGFDAGTSDRTMTSANALTSSFAIAENSYLPVFGIKRGGNGYLAIIADGAPKATVKANTSGKYTSYNNIYSGYQYRVTGNVRLLQKEFNELTTAVPEKNPDISRNYRVEYNFLAQDKAEYSDMAEVYRNYLIDNQQMKSKVAAGDIPFYMDVYGYVRKTKSFMGVPKDTVIPMTTFADAAEMTNTLTSNGVNNIVARYNYWMKDGYFSKIQTNAKPQSQLGNKSDMQKLDEALTQTGGGLYPTVELINVYKTGNGFSQLGDALNSVSKTPQLQYPFVLDNASKDGRYSPWYLLKPKRMLDFTQKLLGNYKKLGINNVAFASVGEMCYSELTSDGTSRSDIPLIYDAMLDMAREQVDSIMLSGANSFAAVNADHILDTPSKSSRFDIADEDIPFYQMVFHGYANYSLGSTNLSSNPEQMLLKCLETGASPMYSWVYRNASELIGSRSDFLYSADFSKWVSAAADEYKVLNEILQGVSAEPITSHRILSHNIRETTYGGKLKIIVNYSSASANVDGTTIPAGGYAVIQLDGKERGK